MATLILLDRVIGMLALFLVLLLLAPLFTGLLGSSTALQLLLVAAGAIATGITARILVALSPSVRRSRWLVWLLAQLPLGRYAERMLDTIHEYRNDRGTLVAAIGISGLAHGVMVIVTLLIAEAVAPGGAAGPMALLIPMGFLTNVIPVTPGGLGVGEAAFDALFSIAGLDGGAEIVLGWRLLALLIGLMGLVLYLQGQRRLVEARLTTRRLEGSA